MGLKEIYANAYDILLQLPLDINVLCDIHYSRKRGDERRTTNLRKLLSTELRGVCVLCVQCSGRHDWGCRRPADA